MMKTRMFACMAIAALLVSPLYAGQENERIVLTPKPGPAPRINGARIFGVRPGSPFLFTVPATGNRPLAYGAVDLPRGLVLNPQTGQFTGSIAEPGTYRVGLTVTNAFGRSERELRIVCGDVIALTPHMGWNSWYVHENHVTDRIMRDAAAAMVASGMMDHGYMYVNIDDCWSVKPGAHDSSLGGEARDQWGRINANRRFPDMKGLTSFIHGLGLKAGIYTSPGPTTCAGHVGAAGHERDDVRRFVEWGFDFLKYDWCSYDGLAKDTSRVERQKPYVQIARIIKDQRRDIVLNMCQYGMSQVWEWGRDAGGNSWRTAGDLGGSFEEIGHALFRDGFDLYSERQLDRYSGPGAWNDPDYLLLGSLSNWKGQIVPSPLTPNEQYTQVSLWALVAAPLIFSGDIAHMDEFTIGLLTNDEVIEIDQDPLGRAGSRVRKEGPLEVWSRLLEDGSIAVGLFNRGDSTATVTARWADLNLEGSCRVRDVWRQQDQGDFSGEYSSEVGRHGVRMIRVTKR
jgi:alpha-galactosidase